MTKTEHNNAGVIIASFLFLSAFLFVENWMLMIFLGSLHSVFNFIPAPGFWTVFWFNLILGIVLNTFKRPKK